MGLHGRGEDPKEDIHELAYTNHRCPPFVGRFFITFEGLIVIAFRPTSPNRPPNLALGLKKDHPLGGVPLLFCAKSDTLLAWEIKTTLVKKS